MLVGIGAFLRVKVVYGVLGSPRPRTLKPRARKMTTKMAMSIKSNRKVDLPGCE